MDGRAAIDDNREALKRILASLFAMAGLGGQFTLFPQEGAGSQAVALAEKSKLSPALTLPRHLHRAVLRLLRPAESAARRLIIALARGLVVTLPPPRKPKPCRPAYISPHGRSGPVALPRAAGPRPPARSLSLPLLDPLRRPFRVRRPSPSALPRISVPGCTGPSALPLRGQPFANDPIDATHLGRRLAALAAAIDDLPGQARRFARWRTRRDAAGAQNKAAFAGQKRGMFRRISPLRAGRPPGGRLARFDPFAVRRRNVREVDEVLAHAHALAIFALQCPDTS